MDGGRRGGGPARARRALEEASRVSFPVGIPMATKTNGFQVLWHHLGWAPRLQGPHHCRILPVQGVGGGRWHSGAAWLCREGEEALAWLGAAPQTPASICEVVVPPTQGSAWESAFRAVPQERL